MRGFKLMSLSFFLTSYVKWRLSNLLSDQDSPDLLTLLPPELQLAVLQFVDGPSLLNASQASREWNVYVFMLLLYGQFYKNQNAIDALTIKLKVFLENCAGFTLIWLCF